jgi:hypothetical protein
MIKGIKITLILVLFSNCLFGQMDSIGSQIMKYEDSKSIIISKGRNLLLDKFIEGDLKKVKEVKDYLVKNEDHDYFAFYPAEYWLILYWTNDYSELAKDIQNYDSVREESFNTRIHPLRDMLYVKLKEKTVENQAIIKKQIQDADMDSETKQMLLLNFDYLMIENRYSNYTQDSLNNQVNKFLNTFASSKFERYAKKYIRYKLIPKDWGTTFEFFSGYGLFTGNLGKNYSNNVPIGVAFDICYKNFELYLRDYFGINETKRDFVYSKGTWKKGSGATVFLLEASLGYVAYNNNRFKVSPFAGIGSMNIGPSDKATAETPEIEEVSLDFTTTYLVGINFDVKFGPKHRPEYNPKTSYLFMRIRYGYSVPTFEKKYDGMTGNMHYVTIGFGSMARGAKRKL